MSLRARHSRALATCLSESAGTPVIARFDKHLGCYVLCWQAGPAVQTMSLLVRERIGRFTALRLDHLRYVRTVGATANRPDGSWVTKPVLAPEHRGPIPVVPEDRVARNHQDRCA